jgi:hypothetical protein
MAKHRIAWEKTYGIPVNSTITLLQPLTIPVRDTQIFLQENRTKPQHGWSGSYDEYYPFCYFEVRDIAETEQVIEPDTFTITDVYLDETEIVQTRPTRLASLIAMGGDADGGIQIIVQTTVMRLSSSKQPQMKMLVCGGGFAPAPFAETPKIEEIRRALGDIARLDLLQKQ